MPSGNIYSLEANSASRKSANTYKMNISVVCNNSMGGKNNSGFKSKIR